MKNYITLILALGAILLFEQCKKSSDTITISGYTATTSQGVITSNDATNWQTNSQVPSQIMTILNGLPLNVGSGGGVDSFCGSLLAYPNPCTGAFVFSISNTCSSAFCTKFIIVDQNIHVYQSSSVPCGGQRIISMNVDSLSNGLYGLYYAFYDSTGKEFGQGYGNILKN